MKDANGIEIKIGDKVLFNSGNVVLILKVTHSSRKKISIQLDEYATMYESYQDFERILRVKTMLMVELNLTHDWSITNKDKAKKLKVFDKRLELKYKLGIREFTKRDFAIL